MEQGQTLPMVQLCMIYWLQGWWNKIEEGKEFSIFMEQGQTLSIIQVCVICWLLEGRNIMVEEGKWFSISLEQGQTLFIVQLCVVSWFQEGRNINHGWLDGSKAGRLGVWLIHQLIRTHWTGPQQQGPDWMVRSGQVGLHLSFVAVQWSQAGLSRLGAFLPLLLSFKHVSCTERMNVRS